MCDCFCGMGKIKQQLGDQIVGYMTATVNKSSLHMVTVLTECQLDINVRNQAVMR